MAGPRGRPDCIRRGCEVNWLPIDTAPTNGATVLLFLNGDDIDFGYFEDGRWWVINNSGGKDFPALGGRRCKFDRPTHWLPIPEPPEVAHG